VVGLSWQYVRTSRREATKKELKKGILPLFNFWYFSSKKSTPSFFFSARQKTRAAKAARFFFILP